MWQHCGRTRPVAGALTPRAVAAAVAVAVARVGNSSAVDGASAETGGAQAR